MDGPWRPRYMDHTDDHVHMMIYADTTRQNMAVTYLLDVCTMRNALVIASFASWRRNSRDDYP